MIKKDNILFLLRSYNEGNHLLNTLDTIKKEGFSKILVVDDGSTDGTFDQLRNRQDIFYLRHIINRGAGAALQTGFEFVKRFYKKIDIEYVVTFDPDGQHDIQDIYKFIEKFENNKDLDVVLGSRFLKQTYENMPFTRKLILNGAKFFTFVISGIKVSDPHNGYKMFKVSAIEKISLTLDGFEYASELIDQISQNNLSFTEVPVKVIYTDYSLSKGQRTLNGFNILFKILWFKFLK